MPAAALLVACHSATVDDSGIDTPEDTGPETGATDSRPLDLSDFSSESWDGVVRIERDQLVHVAEGGTIENDQPWGYAEFYGEPWMGPLGAYGVDNTEGCVDWPVTNAISSYRDVGSVFSVSIDDDDIGLQREDYGDGEIWYAWISGGTDECLCDEDSVLAIEGTASSVALPAIPRLEDITSRLAEWDSGGVLQLEWDPGDSTRTRFVAHLIDRDAGTETTCVLRDDGEAEIDVPAITGRRIIIFERAAFQRFTAVDNLGALALFGSGSVYIVD